MQKGQSYGLMSGQVKVGQGLGFFLLSAERSKLQAFEWPGESRSRFGLFPAKCRKVKAMGF